MLINSHYILIEYFIDNYQIIKGLFQSKQNAIIHARLYKSKSPQSYIEYRVYCVNSGVIYEDLQPIFDTKGDEFPW